MKYVLTFVGALIALIIFYAIILEVQYGPNKEAERQYRIIHEYIHRGMTKGEVAAQLELAHIDFTWTSSQSLTATVRNIEKGPITSKSIQIVINFHDGFATEIATAPIYSGL